MLDIASTRPELVWDAVGILAAIVAIALIKNSGPIAQDLHERRQTHE